MSRETSLVGRGTDRPGRHGDGDGASPQGPSGLRPDPAVRSAVHTTCRRLYEHEQQFLDALHTCLLQLAPGLGSVLAGGGRPISDAVGRSVLWAGLTRDPDATVEETFRAIGAEHARQGFPDDAYHGMGHALLRAARDVRAREWTSELSSSWVAFYAWIGHELITGAAGVRRQGPAPVPTPAAGLRTPWPGTPVLGVPAGGTAPVTGPVPVRVPARPGRMPVPAGATAPRTMREVLAALRTHLPDDERAVASVCTRIALRTGVELLAPSPQQDVDRTLVAVVCRDLGAMGYPVLPGGAASARPAAPPPDQEQARHGWRRAFPHLFR